MTPLSASAHGRCADHALNLRVLGQCVRLHCSDAALVAVLNENFSLLRGPAAPVSDLSYAIGRGCDGIIAVRRDARLLGTAADEGDALFLVEQDLRLELQLRRPDLLFLHAAALSWHGNACLLAGESGAGKSTATWALLQDGLAYLSDELGPVEPQSLMVHAYPHALCMKRPPPPGYSLPPWTMDLGATLHIGAHHLPASQQGDMPHPLAAIFFVSHRSACPVPQRLSPGEAAARLYVVTLNALAHEQAGLEAVARIAERVPSYALGTACLGAACDAMRAMLAHTPARGTACEGGAMEGGAMVAAKARPQHPVDHHSP